MFLFGNNSNNEDLRARVEASEKRLEEFESLAKALVQAKENQNQQTEVKSVNLKEENEKLKTRCDRWETELSIKKSEFDELQRDYESNNLKLQEMQERCAMLEQEKSQVNYRVTELEDKLKTKHSEYADLADEFEANEMMLKNKINQLEAELIENNKTIGTMEKSYKTLLQNHINVKDKLTKELKTHLLQLSEKQDEVKKLTAECNNLKNQVEIVKRNHKYDAEKKDKKFEELKDRHEKTQSYAVKLEDHYKAKKDDYTKTISEMTKKIFALRMLQEKKTFEEHNNANKNELPVFSFKMDAEPLRPFGQIPEIPFSRFSSTLSGDPKLNKI